MKKYYLKFGDGSHKCCYVGGNKSMEILVYYDKSLKGYFPIYN